MLIKKDIKKYKDVVCVMICILYEKDFFSYKWIYILFISYVIKIVPYI